MMTHWLMCSGGGGAEQQRFPRRHGGAEEGERGGAPALCSEIPTDRRATDRQAAAGGGAYAQVIDIATNQVLSIHKQRLKLFFSSCSENRCAELREELANQRAEFSHQLESLRAELDSEGDALQAAFQDSEERRRQREMEVGGK